MWEVRRIQINLVGALSSKEEFREIENVVKVFFVEERIIDIASHTETKNFIEKDCIGLQKKQVINQNGINKSTQLFSVKGLD